MIGIELITTGSELLIDRINTHVVFIGKSLQSLGLGLTRQTSVGDGDEMMPVLREALSRSQVILVTGGLGPTSDDLTRDIAADLLNLPLQHDAAVEETIREYFLRRGLNPPASVYRQALVPQGAIILPNRQGTAPGLLMEHNGVQLFLLPGPPRELIPMWQECVEPFLRDKAGPLRPVFFQFEIGGIGESAVQERLEEPLRRIAPGIGIAYCASPGRVELRLTHTDAECLQPALELVRRTLRRAVQSEGGEKVEERVVRLARSCGMRLATAESCTGGLLAHRLTNVPGASEVLEYGWVTYANAAKVHELGVAEELFNRYGAVSAPVARAMAVGALERSGADLAVSLTGIAGPGGGTPEKPVGLLYAAMAVRVHRLILVHAMKKHLVPDRETFKTMATNLALDLFLRRLIHYNH